MQFIKRILTGSLLTFCISVVDCEEPNKTVGKVQVENLAPAKQKTLPGQWKGIMLDGRDSISYEFFDARDNRQAKLKNSRVELKSKSIHFDWHFKSMVCREYGYSFRKSFDSLIVAQTDSTGVAVFAGGWAIGQLWLFWVAPIVGGVLGAFIYRFIGSSKG